MFETVSDEQLPLLIRALNTEANLIQREIDRLTKRKRYGAKEVDMVTAFVNQRSAVLAMLGKAQREDESRNGFEEEEGGILSGTAELAG